MDACVDFVHLIVSYSCLLFAATNVVMNLIILTILNKGRQYRSNFFYTIYMIGCAIDVCAMVGNHVGAIFPSRGWFLDFFLSSTITGRLFLLSSWGSRSSQGFTALLISVNRATAVLRPMQYNTIWSSRFNCVVVVVFQLSGMIFGVLAATRDVYWVQVDGGGWYIQFVQNASTRRFFVGTFSVFTAVVLIIFSLYALLMCKLRAVKTSSNGMERRQDLSLLYIAIVVCTQEIIYYITYAYAFVKETNFEMDLRVFYIGFFIINDVYGGLSPYLLIIFSKPVRKDFLRMFRFGKARVDNTVSFAETRNYDTMTRNPPTIFINSI